MSDFKSLLEQGKLTEIKIAKWFENCGFRVEDVSDNDYYKAQDIDLIIYGQDNVGHTVEIKSDEVMHKTNNLFIEQGMDRTNGWKKGWFYYCKAKIICYHDNVNDVGQVLDWRKMQEEITQYYKSRRFWNSTDRCYGWGWIIPIEDARQKGWIIKEYILKKIIK